MATIWLLGGLGAFLLGVRRLTRGLELLGGPAVRRSLGRFAQDPAAAWLAGALAAAMFHSSGLVTVVVVGLVQAGVIGMPAAIGAVLGANVGTTATAQMLAFSTGFAGWLGVALGVALRAAGRLRARPARWVDPAGEAVLGTGLVFLGLEALGAAFTGADLAWPVQQLLKLAGRPVTGLLAGAVLTGAVQSSTVFIGVVMKLAEGGRLPLAAAIHLVLGSNVGSCLPGVLAGALAGSAGWWAGLTNLVFNVAGAVLALPLVPAFSGFIAASAKSYARQVANAHGLFNLVTALAALPFAWPVGRWLERGNGSKLANPRNVGRRVKRNPAWKRG